MRRYLYLLLTGIMLSLPSSLYADENKAMAIFAGGCFWCMQADFDKVPGVIKTTVGYIGGKTHYPTYPQVSAGQTGHVEAVEVIYDPQKTSYQNLLDVFWVNVDPTNADGQFCDRGYQYTSALFYLNNKQKKLALASKNKIINSKRFPKVVTKVAPAKTFYPAEPYHQDYYKKNSLRYKVYRFSCGRDARLKRLWN